MGKSYSYNRLMVQALVLLVGKYEAFGGSFGVYIYHGYVILDTEVIVCVTGKLCLLQRMVGLY